MGLAQPYLSKYYISRVNYSIYSDFFVDFKIVWLFLVVLCVLHNLHQSLNLYVYFIWLFLSSTSFLISSCQECIYILFCLFVSCITSFRQFYTCSIFLSLFIFLYFFLTCIMFFLYICAIYLLFAYFYSCILIFDSFLSVILFFLIVINDYKFDYRFFICASSSIFLYILMIVKCVSYFHVVHYVEINNLLSIIVFMAFSIIFHYAFHSCYYCFLPLRHFPFFLFLFCYVRLVLLS